MRNSSKLGVLLLTAIIFSGIVIIPRAVTAIHDTGISQNQNIRSPKSTTPGIAPPTCPPNTILQGDHCVSTIIKYPPISNAGHANFDQIINVGQKVTLDGTQSFSRTANDSIASYQWSQTRGPHVDLTTAGNPAIVNFVAPNVPGDSVMKFRLVVTDQLGLVDVDYTSLLLRTPMEPPGGQLAVSDAQTTVQAGQSISMVLVSSLSDQQGEMITYKLVSPSSSHGTVVTAPTVPLAVNRQAVTYTPNQGFSGQDSFGYQATDNFGRVSNVGIITLNVVAPTPPPPPPPPPPSGTAFDFGAAGDFGSDSNAAATAQLMVSKGINLFVGEGDYCYCGSDGSWWTGVMKPLQQSGILAKGSEGNHEVEDSHGGNDLAALWGMGSFSKSQSFDFKDTHFVLLPEDSATPDPNWLDKDLAAARANSAIKWIVMVFHEPIYTPKSDHAPDENGIKSTVLPLIDKYHVDLVLQAHNHLYGRMFPMAGDKVTDQAADSNYVNPKGSLYMVIGTGGQDLYSLGSQGSNVQKQFTGDHGFVDFHVTDTKITGTYYSDSGGTVKDAFSISK